MNGEGKEEKKKYRALYIFSYSYLLPLLFLRSFSSASFSLSSFRISPSCVFLFLQEFTSNLSLPPSLPPSLPLPARSVPPSTPDEEERNGREGEREGGTAS